MWTAAAALVYVLVEGHPAVPLSGRPFGLSGAMVVTGLIVLAWWWRRVRLPATGRATAVIAFLVLLKLVVGLAAPQQGWVAQYYVNDRFAEPMERSTDFLDLGATRLDRTIAFQNDTFPEYFLNDLRFELPAGRSQLYVEQPLSVRWRGVLDADVPRREEIALEAHGRAWVTVDGVEQLRIDTLASGVTPTAGVDLAAGPHQIEVFYVKPANTAGRITLTHATRTGLQPWGAPDVQPGETDRTRLAAVLAPVLTAVASAKAVAWTLHAAVAIALLWCARRVWSRTPDMRASFSAAAESWLYAAILAGFAVQGVIKGTERVNRVWDLTSGDDWFGFEARARDLLLNGPLMTLGDPIGQGKPFFYYPLYSYFAAGVHWLVGEDGSGIVFAQFLVLALTTIVVHRLANELFGPRVALAAALFFIAIAELAFARYYTVTMLADNLYILPVAAAVYCLTRYARTGAMRTLAGAGVLVGIAALTKPSMLAFLPLSLGFVAWRARRSPGGLTSIAVHCAAYGVAALAVMSVATVRNQIVAGRPVLITEGQADTFVRYALPPDVTTDDKSPLQYEQSFGRSLVTVFRLFRDHPIDYLRWNGRKVVFSLGFVHLAHGYRPHPELLLAMAGYLMALILVPRARAPEAWPAHLFVLSHVAMMVLSLPWVYGYRLILPIFLFAPVFASAAGVALWDRLRLRASRSAHVTP